MSSVEELTPRVREALGVSDSYDADTIPALIRRCIKRLLRDYHFPKSLSRREYDNAAEGDQSWTLPDGFKKEHQVQWYDPSGIAWSEPLRKSEGFRRPAFDGFPMYYWLEGTKLYIDTPVPTGMVDYTLQVWYESTDLTANESWFVADFEDAIFYFSIVRGAAEMRKPEVMQAFAPLWTDEQTSLAIYLNELEFGNLYMQMREPAPLQGERYPKS